jgi:hypothetical protein
MDSPDFPESPSQPVLLDPPSASNFLTKRGFATATRTLAKLRCVGGGPQFRRFGRLIRYERGALESWAQQRLSRPLRNTSEVNQVVNPK